jgi:ATP adenylyltransferase/5',5'''-P-1,P-4-tetraphosphate phosphorylase II
MHNKRIIKDSELKNSGNVESFADRAHTLLTIQMEKWHSLNKGYKNLDSVETRELEIDGTKVTLQFNPQRIISSTAKVDEKSIKDRKCFLCVENLPDEQKAVQYGNDFLILGNPYPIFPEHFTISKIKHIPQRIKKSFEDLINLSRDLGKYYSVFYNGPECGASAPDHLHFQACTKNFMPIENSIKATMCRAAGKNSKLEVFAAKNFVRKFISFESTSKIELLNIFKIFYDGFSRLPGTSIEPMVNIISSYENNKWRVIIFPRRKHRPDFYFKEGSDKILISPAASDLGGICITPRREDFDKVTKENLEKMFDEILVSTEFFEFLINRCETYFRH